MKGVYEDLVGKDFDSLHVAENTGKRSKYGDTLYRATCSCGHPECRREVIVDGNNLRRGRTKSCGVVRGRKREDLIGQTFNNRTVLTPDGKKWLCRCNACSKEKVVSRASLKGHTCECSCPPQPCNHISVVFDRLKRDTGPKGECWEYTGSRDREGYGRLEINGRQVAAHRAAYCHANGLELSDISELHVMHRCDNPACCRPNHLRLGTPNDNNHEMINRGRARIVGSQNGQAKLDEKQVIAIRADRRPYKDIARQYKISESTVSQIKTRHSWKHVGGVDRRHTTPELVARILSDPRPPKEIAEATGVSLRTVYRIKAKQRQPRKAAA